MFLKKLIIVSEKGQEASEAFRLLTAFIVALAILGIILAMIHKVDQQTLLVSTERFEEGIVSASKAPGTSAVIPFLIQDIVLKGTISKLRLSNLTGYSKECLIFQLGPGLELDAQDNAIVLKDKLKMDVWVYCNFGGDNVYSLPGLSGGQQIDLDELSNCPQFCLIFMNKKPPQEFYPGQTLK